MKTKNEKCYWDFSAEAPAYSSQYTSGGRSSIFKVSAFAVEDATTPDRHA